MAGIAEHIRSIKASLPPHVTLVAISKFQTTEAIIEAYQAGQRDFGESRVQELHQKINTLQAQYPDIRWHYIGHLQTNKVRELLALPVYLIQSVDSLHVLQAIDRECERTGRSVKVLLEVHVAQEETKTGLSEEEYRTIRHSEFHHVQIVGTMGMATNTEDTDEIERCFRTIAAMSNPGDIVSMGMSDDYEMAIQCGSNMIRIGSSIFGERPTP